MEYAIFDVTTTTTTTTINNENTDISRPKRAGRMARLWVYVRRAVAELRVDVHYSLYYRYNIIKET